MKMLKVLVAALLVAAMVTPAIAEDRLSLSGEMRVRAFHVDEDFSGDTDDSTDTWANQRLRIAGKIAVNENVSVTFRTDITEGTNWGDETAPGGIIRSNGAGSGRSGAQQQWDRAHLDINVGNFHLRAGQQYVGTGGAFAVDTQDNGLLVDVKGAVPVTAYVLVDENNSADLGGDGADGFLYGVTATVKPAKVFVAGLTDGEEEEAYVIGANGSFDLDAIKLFAELDVFTGDAAAANTDAMGTQATVDASMAVSDTATVGAQLYYALGTDDADEKQYVVLGNGFNGYDPIFDVGTSLSNEEIALQGGGAKRVFDWTDSNAGVIGARLYGSTKMGATKLGASIAYLDVEEDAIVDADAIALAAGLVYDIVDNASFQVQLQYTDGEENGGDFDSFEAGTGLFVNF